VAIPLFGTRVSPRFDCGTALLLAEVEGSEVASQEEIPDAFASPLHRIARFRELGVQAVVCGAITGFLRRHLEANGIRVFPWVFGEAGEALESLARGELPPAARGGWGRGRGCGRRARGRARRRRPRQDP
jgi:predicted Fe-Mo cluster-binding NifX family protein